MENLLPAMIIKLAEVNLLYKNLIEGKFVFIRDVEIEDAEFILKLRCDEKKAKYLHKTEYNVSKQIDYIKKYKELNNEWYFIIENKKHTPIGTYRIYDLKEDSFCIGSWLMVDGATPLETLEGEYLVKMFAFEKTGFTKFHFDVRKENKKVLRYHKMMGAKIVGETDIDYLFECTKADYLENIKKYLY